MGVIDGKNIIAVLKKAYSLMDNEILEHCERVAFIVNRMLLQENKEELGEIELITFLALFHDIGAYKINEQDDVVTYEVDFVAEHSIYGYLFMKSFFPVKYVADCILHHHQSFDELEKSDCQNKKWTGFIHFADVIDLILMGHIEKSKEYFTKKQSKLFDETYELFLKADENYHIVDALLHEDFNSEIKQLAEGMVLVDQEIDEFMQMLAFSIDFRSEYTVSHTINTVRISGEIAQLMGIDELSQEEIYYGSLLHDVGKIATPIKILDKPGRLDEQELAIMNKHVINTAEIISEISNEAIKNIALRHHEKLDGTGYPYGLKDEDLTLPEKIVAVADIISALSDERSYKKAFDKDKVINILMQLRDDYKLSADVVNVVAENYEFIIINAKKSAAELLVKYDNLQKDFNRLLEVDRSKLFNSGYYK